MTGLLRAVIGGIAPLLRVGPLLTVLARGAFSRAYLGLVGGGCYNGASDL